MTLERLNKYARLRRELEEAENLKAVMESAVGLKAQVMTGLPHAPGYKNKLGNIIPKILDDMPLIEAQIESLRREARSLESEISGFISAIPDFQTRAIFKLRFLGGFTWAWVARTVGGGNSADTIKKRCYRYLDSHS